MVILDQKAIAIQDVVPQTDAERPTKHTVHQAAGAYARVIQRELRNLVARSGGNQLVEKPHVGGSRATSGPLARRVPRPVGAYHNPLVSLFQRSGVLV